MNTSSDLKSQKPSIIQSLRSGFNTVANKPALILIPIALDLFLWFGPGWRVERVFLPLVQGMTNLPDAETGEILSLLESSQEILLEILANFNLAVTLQTFPIGVPSLMASKPSFLNPMGQPPIFNLTNQAQFIALLFVFLLCGYFLGSLYFQNISKQVISLNNDNFRTLLKAYLQIVLMPIVLILILFILAIPLTFLVTLFSLISPAIGQIFTMLALFFFLWAFVPLVFTPHGIFLYKQNLLSAVKTSIKVVRISMSKTIWFILVSFLMVEGLNYLWRSPNVDNWFLIVGIMGHAFIVSAVIAASFHYYLDASQFSQSVLQQNLKTA